jgi:SAM-dependent methyltransferase
MAQPTPPSGDFAAERMAQAYDEFTSDPYSFASLIERPALEALLGDLSGKLVIDLGCGTGRYSLLLAERGARVIGIDISAAMLRIARSKAAAQGLPLELRQADILAPEAWPEEPADLVLSAAVTHFLPALDPLMRGVAAALRPGGRLLLSAMHPIYTSQHPVARPDETSFPTDEDWAIRYFDRTPRRYVEPWVEFDDSVENFLTQSYHHTVSDYVNAVLGAGLQLTRLLEPRPPEELKHLSPSRYEIAIEYPLYMILEAVRPPAESPRA